MVQLHVSAATTAMALLLDTGALAQVVINEVDLDQVGTDNTEFLEIKNVGESAFPLQYLRVVLINGNNGGSEVYRSLEDPSWPSLEPGDYFVICGNQGLTLNCDYVATPSTNLIQNGSPDAIALVSTLTGTVVDMLSYGGSVAGYTETTGTSAEDTNLQDGLSLCRWPDGADTDDNDVDFQIGCLTPGAANLMDSVNCVNTTGVMNLPLQALFDLVPDAQGLRVLFGHTRSLHLGVSVFALNGNLVATRVFATAHASEIFIPLTTGQLYLVQVRLGNQVGYRRILLP